MARVFAIAFALMCAVYFFEIYSGRSFGFGEQVHNLGSTVAEFTGMTVFSGSY